MVGGRFIYLSRARVAFSDSELMEIAAKSARKNARQNITGVLIKTTDYLLQVLDGPYLPVMHLLESIQQDTRHTEMRILYKEAVTLGLFSDWSMGYLNLDTLSETDRKNTENLRAALQQVIANSPPSKDALTKIVQSLPIIVNTMRQQGNRI